ncbi:hypothetical protein EDD18DRAFT_1472476, partial [Armillaria luteobubalina]
MIETNLLRIAALRIAATPALPIIRNLALLFAVIWRLPKTELRYMVKELKAYMAYLPDDVVVTHQYRAPPLGSWLVASGLRPGVHSVQRFTAHKLDRSLWHRIEVLNANMVV